MAALKPRRARTGALLGELKARARQALDWFNASSLGRHVQKELWLRRKRRGRIILPPYVNTAARLRKMSGFLLAPVLTLFCLFYGFFFAILAPHLLMIFIIPLAIIVLLIVWSLPNQKNAPTWGIEFFFAAYFITKILWPDYLAISLPGLPWITAARLTGFPMFGLFLISISVSNRFRKTVTESFSAIPLLRNFMIMLIGYYVISIAFSTGMGASVQEVLLFFMFNFMIFVVSTALFRDVKFIERYWILLCLLSLPLAFLAFFEAQTQHLLWLNYIPKFLRVPDPSVSLILRPSFRPGIHLYRVKTVFRTQLDYSEYLALLTPFALHFGFTAKRLWQRIASLGLLPLNFVVIRLTDSRAGLVGMLACILLYGCFWSVGRWRRNKSDLLSAAILFAYPVSFFGALAAVFSSNRLTTLLLGGGAQASSTEARSDQLAMGLVSLSKRPWGYGPGRSGEAMGFAADQFVTIDNWFINIGLELGVAGLVLWTGVFIIGIIVATQYAFSDRYAQRSEVKLLGPLAVGLASFLVIKWVHGQGELHAIPFMMLGMISALVYRLRDPALNAGPSVNPRPPGQRIHSV